MQSAVEAALTTPPFGITSSSPVHDQWAEPSPMHIDTVLCTSGSQAQGSEGDLQQQNVADTLAQMQDDPDPYALPSVPSDLAKDKEVLTGVFADAHKAGLRPFSPPGSDPFTVSQEIYRSESRSRDVPPANKRAPTEGISHHFSWRNQSNPFQAFSMDSRIVGSYDPEGSKFHPYIISLHIVGSYDLSNGS